jgi:hypothetical protein
MAATYVSPLPAHLGLGLRYRFPSRIGLVAAALALLAVAGLATALLLVKSSSAPPATSLTPSSTLTAPQP